MAQASPPPGKHNLGSVTCPCVCPPGLCRVAGGQGGDPSRPSLRTPRARGRACCSPSPCASAAGRSASPPALPAAPSPRCRGAAAAAPPRLAAPPAAPTSACAPARASTQENSSVRHSRAAGHTAPSTAPHSYLLLVLLLDARQRLAVLLSHPLHPPLVLLLHFPAFVAHELAELQGPQGERVS